jgi:hypothetical protein
MLKRPRDAVARRGGFIAGVDFYDHIQHDSPSAMSIRDHGPRSENERGRLPESSGGAFELVVRTGGQAHRAAITDDHMFPPNAWGALPLVFLPCLSHPAAGGG